MSNGLDALVSRLGYRSYNAYLRGEHWKLFSDAIRAKRCFCCNNDRNLQVHHKTFIRLGEELPTDVVTLCGVCHESVHELSGAGEPLVNAHLVHRKSLGRGRRSDSTTKQEDKGWVRWERLQNKSAQQSLGQLKAFLVEKGLWKGYSPTKAAFEMKFAKRVRGGEVLWHLNRYLAVMKADKWVKKAQVRGRWIPHIMFVRALMTDAIGRSSPQNSHIKAVVGERFVVPPLPPKSLKEMLAEIEIPEWMRRGKQ